MYTRIEEFIITLLNCRELLVLHRYNLIFSIHSASAKKSEQRARIWSETSYSPRVGIETGNSPYRITAITTNTSRQLTNTSFKVSI